MRRQNWLLQKAKTNLAAPGGKCLRSRGEELSALGKLTGAEQGKSRDGN
jgi:hypothetical protein